MSELKGKRALVTGASSGIGAAIAQELARRGVNLVLSARRRPLLDETAAFCGRQGITTDVVVADLGDPSGARTLWREASRTPVDILVNNAGFGYFRPYSDVDWQRDAELVQLNITSLVELSRAFVDHRKARDGRAYLLNIASIGAYQSVPNMALYAASKAFVRNFTEGLHDEWAGTKLSATCICPGGTKTEFHAMAGAGNYGWVANYSMMTAEDVARIAVHAMERGKRNVIPGLMNKLSCWGVRFVPRWFASWMSRRVLGKPRPGELPARSAEGPPGEGETAA
jgi:short-subunit dehydrogenase